MVSLSERGVVPSENKDREPNLTGIAFKFPGQGAQYPEMAKSLVESPNAKLLFDEASEILGFDLLDVCTNGSEDDLRPTEIAQPAILVTSIALINEVKQSNSNLPKPAFYLGHSLGEYTAFVVSGALKFDEGVKLIRERSRIMKQGCLNNPGGMAAISGEGINVEHITDICAAISRDDKKKIVQVANINTPEQIVISGTNSGLKEACSAIVDLNGFRITPLDQVGGAYHSLLMDPENELSEHISSIHFNDTKTPIILNTTGRPTTSGEEMKKWAKVQLVRTVIWNDSVKFALDSGVKTFAQFGPGNVLIALLRRIDRSARGIKVNDLRSAYDFASQFEN